MTYDIKDDRHTIPSQKESGIKVMASDKRAQARAQHTNHFTNRAPTGKNNKG